MSGSAGGEAEDSGERPLPVPARAPEPARGEVVEAPAGSLLERIAAGPLAGPALAAAGGFVAGFAAFVAARVLRGRGPARLGRRRRRALERQIESSRSFLVDVHVLRR
ncbi:MAG TPA: hypothetical protein VK387_04040 [Thermoleophilaceae bacterium]|nr:hypothetical protein [Thermoleophilaceae bacterium]